MTPEAACHGRGDTDSDTETDVQAQQAYAEWAVFVEIGGADGVPPGTGSGDQFTSTPDFHHEQ